MVERNISDERLTALADGELPEADAAELRALIADDAALAERYALFAETRELLAPEPRKEIDEGHDRLAAAIRAADAASGPSARSPFSVIEGGAREAARPVPSATVARPAARFWTSTPALAASLALVVGGALGFAMGRGGTGGEGAGEIVAVAGAPAADAALASALEGTPSGERLAWSDDRSSLKGAVSIVSTHRLGDGRICREYEVSVDGRDGAAVGLSCRGDKGSWSAEAVARNGGGAGYATASGASVVENTLEGLGGQGALSLDEEKDLLSKAWRP